MEFMCAKPEDAKKIYRVVHNFFQIHYINAQFFTIKEILKENFEIV
jgi:hypothetical protein